ncbi:hypothetical protein GCM10023079_36550 [Streptomyces chitinivorans]
MKPVRVEPILASNRPWAGESVIVTWLLVAAVGMLRSSGNGRIARKAIGDILPGVRVPRGGVPIPPAPAGRVNRA